MDLLVKNGTIVTSTDVFRADIGVSGGKIVEIKKRIATPAETVIDAKGKYVLPGVIDPHTHMELKFMGATSADDFEAGTIAAAFGGVTTIIDFAVQPRGKTLLRAIELWRRKADPKVVIDYSLHVAVTDLNEERLAEIPKVLDYGVTSFKLFMTYRRRGLMSEDWQILEMLKASGNLRFLVLVHAENPSIEEHLKQKYLKEGKTSVEYHPRSRPNFVEGEAARRAIYFAQVSGGNLYIVHTSTEEALAAAESAVRSGVKVYVETCPQYLMLTEREYLQPNGRFFAVSPPLRSKKDNEALWSGLAKGIVKTVGSDHCPFTSAQKDMGKDDFTKIPNGLPGTEVILPILYSKGVGKKRITINRLVEVTSSNAAKLFGLYPRKGTIAEGSDADLAILDPKFKMELSQENLHSKIDYSIYEGLKVEGVPVTTISRGEPVVLDRQFVGKRGGGGFVPRELTTTL
jgi:dihydropyrimidinase